MANAAPPTREDISAAYQSAVKGGQVAAVAPTAPAPQPVAPAARRMDPDEVAGLLKRAKSLLAVGDIASARLLLERAADTAGCGACAAGATAATWPPFTAD